MIRKPNALKAAALCAIFASSALGNNLFVLPTFTGNATSSAQIYNGNPLALAGSFTSDPSAFRVFAKPSSNPAETKYYVISKAGSSSLLILDSNLAPVQGNNPRNLGQNVTAAALTPDGRRLLIFAGNLSIINTQDDTLIQGSFLPVGRDIVDIMVTADSTRAVFLSAADQKLTAVDLTTNQIVPGGGITLSLLSLKGRAAIGPNGLIYVSHVSAATPASSRLIEIDPRPTPFDATAIRGAREVSLPGVDLGVVSFTPDGKQALAVNSATQNGQGIYSFNLDLMLPAITSASVPLTGTLASIAYQDIYVVGNDRAYAITSNNSARAKKVHLLQLLAPAALGPLQPPNVFPEPVFGSLNQVEVADTIAFTTEYPQARRMYISAPLKRASNGLADNVIYDVSLTTSPGDVTLPPTKILYEMGPLQFAGPATTSTQERPSGAIQVNPIQPNVPVSGRTLPFGVRVLGSSGRPVFGVTVAFSIGTAGAQIVGNATPTTNRDGIAVVTAVAPSAVGPFVINVAVGDSGLTSVFSFTAGASSGGGGTGGGGTGGGTGTQFVVLEGNGQGIKDGNESAPIKVRLLDSAGKPVAAGTEITWGVTTGGGNWVTGQDFVNNGVWKTTTDANGESSNTFRVPIVVGQTDTFIQSSMTVTGNGTTLTLYATAIRSTLDANPLGSPIPRFTPEELRSIRGKVGQTIPSAVVAHVNFPTLPNQGPIPNLGMTIKITGAGQLPGAECTPNKTVLTDESGNAVCDLKLTRAGSGAYQVLVGGFYESNPQVPIIVDPGDPGALKIINGNSQSGEVNQILPGLLIVELADAGGNILAGQSVNWAVTQGQATLTNTTTITDSTGRASNQLRLGGQSGAILVRASAVNGSQPFAIFEASVKITVTAVTKAGGDNQSTFTNSAFPNPIVVQVVDNRQQPAAGVAINFTVASGSATLSATTATTDVNGRATVTARAGNAPGPIVITASTPGVPQATFNLTSQLPGPLPGAFLNAASSERGAVVPGGIYSLQGTGFAPDLKGCIESVPIIGQLPTKLNGVELQFGATLAPIFSICNLGGQESVTFQAPFELAPGIPVTAIARVGAGSTAINNVEVRDFQPGTFETTDPQGRKFAVALKPDGSFVTPDNPARYGEIIRVYITGAGQVTPAARTGVTGTTGQKLTIDVVVGLNEQGVRVVSAEYARGLIGVYEIQFEIPPGTPTGAARPLGILLARPNGQFIYPENSPTIAIAP